MLTSEVLDCQGIIIHPSISIIEASLSEAMQTFSMTVGIIMSSQKFDECFDKAQATPGKGDDHCIPLVSTREQLCDFMLWFPCDIDDITSAPSL